MTKYLLRKVMPAVLATSSYLLASAQAISGPVILKSPDSTIEGRIETDVSGALSYSVFWHGKQIAKPASIGVSVDAETYGSAVTLEKPVFRQIDESYPINGVKAIAVNHANAVIIPFRQKGEEAGAIEARAYDDGFAWRLCVDGTGRRLVHGETSTWSLPSGKIWYPERNNDWKLKSYAGEYISTDVDSLPNVSSQGPVQMAPLVIELSAGGYELITEAELVNYSGMRLKTIGDRTLQVDFTEGKTGFYIEGPIQTPWRVTLLAKTLNQLVNSDLITNLNPPPDPSLYRDISYIRPGRAVWRWWSRQTGTPGEEKEFVDYATRLNFEYVLVDDGWDDWADHWAAMGDLCAYAKAHSIGVFAWKNYKYLADSGNNWQQLREFLDKARTAGLAGAKIDFINAESKDRIDFEHAALVFAAERRLMIDFHGLQKPTGEQRTYPNAISREAIRGVELNKMAEGPITPSHNAALPFTRYIVSPADYTPLSLTWPGNTTWSQQVATAVLLTSPLLVIAEDPQVLLKDRDADVALGLIKGIPSTWDETRVLPQSSIGEFAGMARRKGTTWYIAVLNGASPSEASIDVAQFASVPMEADVLTSPEKRSFQMTSLAITSSSPVLHYNLAAGDGVVICLRVPDR